MSKNKLYYNRPAANKIYEYIVIRTIVIMSCNYVLRIRYVYTFEKSRVRGK